MKVTIKIMGNEWNISRKTNLELNDICKDTLGVSRFPDREIWLLETLKDKELEQVVRHELSHAYMQEFGLAEVNSVSPEYVCDFMANHLDTIKMTADWIIRHLGDDNK